jgi:hypothetical protein
MYHTLILPWQTTTLCAAIIGFLLFIVSLPQLFKSIPRTLAAFAIKSNVGRIRVRRMGFSSTIGLMSSFYGGLFNNCGKICTCVFYCGQQFRIHNVRLVL